MKTSELNLVAKSLGAAARLSNKPCAPALDKELLAITNGRMCGDKRTANDLRSWIAGWTEANLNHLAHVWNQ